MDEAALIYPFMKRDKIKIIKNDPNYLKVKKTKHLAI